MAAPHERAKPHEGRSLKLPEGELSELNMPVANPGDTGYVNPRKHPPMVADNAQGNPPKAHPGKNY